MNWTLVEERLLNKKPGSAQESFKPKYQITRKGVQYLFSKSRGNLKTICETLQAIINQKFTPNKLHQLREEGSSIPQEAEDRGNLNKEEIVKWIKLHNEVFGPLHGLFFLIAKKLMDAEGPVVHGAQEDLGNVRFSFKNGKPIWTVYPDDRKVGS